MQAMRTLSKPAAGGSHCIRITWPSLSTQTPSDCFRNAHWAYIEQLTLQIEEDKRNTGSGQWEPSCTVPRCSWPWPGCTLLRCSWPRCTSARCCWLRCTSVRCSWPRCTSARCSSPRYSLEDAVDQVALAKVKLKRWTVPSCSWPRCTSTRPSCTLPRYSWPSCICQCAVEQGAPCQGAADQGTACQDAVDQVALARV